MGLKTAISLPIFGSATLTKIKSEMRICRTKSGKVTHTYIQTIGSISLPVENSSEDIINSVISVSLLILILWLSSRKHAYIILTPQTPLLHCKTWVYRGIH